jgi:hypothetical protein
MDLSPDNDKFYLLNKKIFQILSDLSNRKYQPIIVQVDEFPEYYNELLSKISLIEIPLKDELEKYNKKDLTYWKASHKVGHWNQFAHKVVGN